MAFKRTYVLRAHHANRRRQEYTLTQQRYMLPLVLMAALAAVLVHLLVMRAAPWLYDVMGWNYPSIERPDKVEDNEIARVVVREEPVELPNAQEQPLPPDEPAEIDDAAQREAQEIDLLDIDIPELVMAPGETNLTMPEPEPEQNADESPVDDLAPRELDMASLGTDALPDQEALLPELTPINTNSVTINATPQNKVIDDAEALIEKELRRQAKDGRNNLPGDTRSLADLMGVRNPGASSGVARLGTDLLFGFNQCTLKNSARISMLQLAALIHKNPNTRFIIEGHTDGIGSADYNNLLSLQRAAAVCQWLRQNGVPTTNVYMRACGSRQPLVDVRASRDAQALNRRVEIHMRKAEEALPQGCLPASHHVDLKTPVQTQLKNNARPPRSAH